MWSRNFSVLLLVCLIFSPGSEVSSRKLSNIFRSATKKTHGKSGHKKIQPSAPPQPVGWGNNEAQVKHFVPAQTQQKPIDNTNQRPIGWNIGSQLPSSNAGNLGPPQIPNPSNVGSYAPAYVPQPPQNSFATNFGGPGAIPPPYYNAHPNGSPAGSHAPQNSGIGSILGSNILGNALSGLTLWQLIKKNQQNPENHNVINNYYNNGTISVNETVTANQSFPIKQTFDNGTILLRDDTIIYPNGTLILSNGTLFNTVVNRNATVNNNTISANCPNNTDEVNNGTIVEQKDTIMSTNCTMDFHNNTLVINGTLDLKNETESTLNGTKSAPYSSSDITVQFSISISLYSAILILYFFENVFIE